LAISPFGGAFFLNALLGVSDDDGHCSFLGLIASVGLSAFGHIDGCLAALTGEAKAPAAGFSAALFLAVLESSGTFRVLLACSPLGGALLLNALLGVGQSNGSFDLVEAVIVLDAFKQVACLGVALLGNTGGPAGLVVFALLFAVLKH
jgi:hypothetical protein